jgi:DNA (cytosine-5)-methyltransferase 1
MDEIFDILSLFTGGGFLDIGFFNNGFQVREAVEIENAFIYGHNAGLSSYFQHSDNYYIKNRLVTHTPIDRKTDASDKNEIRRLGITHNNITGIVGGPPCQDYSTGGKNAGAAGKRGKLIFSYYKIVEQVRPQFVFFENVTGLINTKVHKEEGFDLLVSQLKELGYEIWYDILNSLEYGLPQDRPRVVLVGFRNDIVETLVNAGFLLEKDNEKLKKEATDNVIFKWPTIQHKDPKKQKWPAKWSFGSRIKQKEIDALPKEYRKMATVSAFEGLTKNTPNQNEYFKPRSIRFYLIEEGDTNRKSFKRLHRFRYSPTVAYGNNEVHLHPTEPRRLTVREALRLQTVPDTYILPKDMTLTAKFKMISNGVPTQKAELVAREIRRTLLFYNAVQNGTL